MLKVVLDTNIIVSASISRSGSPYQVVQAWRRQEIILVLSRAIVEEVTEVLGRPYFREKHHITKSDIASLGQSLERQAMMVVPKEHLDVIGDDPDDDRVLECVVEGGADYLVTGDHHLLELRRYRAIPLVTAKEFLAIVKQRESQG